MRDRIASGSRSTSSLALIESGWLVLLRYRAAWFLARPISSQQVLLNEKLFSHAPRDRAR